MSGKHDIYNAYEGDYEEGTVEADSTCVLSEPRNTEKIEGVGVNPQTWRSIGKMKTINGAIVLCLNLPVDPPDVSKIQPCCRKEAWIDPTSKDPKEAREAIGINLQNAYMQCHKKARYKKQLDPTQEDVRALCLALRRNSKGERVLFHYNGHGVPKPTANGEIWVFNQNMTQYIPLSIYELHGWMGAPTIYVYDCSNAGIIVKQFDAYAEKHAEECQAQNAEINGVKQNPSTPHPLKQCIQLAACDVNEILPMNPDLPADVFTSCLTTPIVMALHWHLLCNKKKYPREIISHVAEKGIPGSVDERKTMLGELNWIFTSITDTIAWNMLPIDLFQKLFRQDSLVASLLRNFILAQRVLQSYDCNPVSSPKLPQTSQHPMWRMWDLTLDLYLNDLQAAIKNKMPHSQQQLSSPFFKEQLDAFQMWLKLGSENRQPPEVLPVLLQVLLSPMYRLMALELLNSFLTLGPWAVNKVLFVGIFPYILRLLQSNDREIRPLLVDLWAKILAVHPGCKSDLISDNGHKYFFLVLDDSLMPVKYRTLAAYVLSVIVRDNPDGQLLALQNAFIPCCLEQINDPDPKLRQWVLICLGWVWHNYPDARWAATRDTAQDKIFNLLSDPVPEVRASTVFALGTFMNSLASTERTEQARVIDHSIAMRLVSDVSQDGSPLVREELLVALQYLLLLYEHNFIMVIKQCFLEEFCDAMNSLTVTGAEGFHSALHHYRYSSKLGVPNSPDTSSHYLSSLSNMSRAKSLHSLPSLGIGSSGSMSTRFNTDPYYRLVQLFILLKSDPYPQISKYAQVVIDHLKSRLALHMKDLSSTSLESTPGTPGAKPRNNSCSSVSSILSPLHSVSKVDPTMSGQPLISTQFTDWCAKQLFTPSRDKDDFLDFASFQTRRSSLLYGMNGMKRASDTILDDHVFMQRNSHPPEFLVFHPEEPYLIVADKSFVTVWDVDRGIQVSQWLSCTRPNSRLTSAVILNPRTPNCYVCTACADGNIRVFKDAFTDTINSKGIVTAFRATSPDVSSLRSVLLSWEQRAKTLAVSGPSKIIRLWDLQAEHKTFECPVGGGDSNSFISALNSSEDGPWVLTGSSDGTVRLIDRRLEPNKAVVKQWYEHTSKVVCANLFSVSQNSTKFITGASSGEVRLWDMRKSCSVEVSLPQGSVTAMATHPGAHRFAISSPSHFIEVHHQNGSLVNIIKQHESFMGQRSSPVSCLAFHPAGTLLAGGTSDRLVSVYASSKR